MNFSTSTGYFLTQAQYDNFCELMTRCTYDEIVFRMTIQYPSFDLDNLKDTFLDSDYRVKNNIVVLPFYTKDGWSLTPWQILNVTKSKTLLNSKWSLENRNFDNGTCKIWKNCTIRQYLNSEKFLAKFPEQIIPLIDDYKVITNDDDTIDNFWLLNYDELMSLVPPRKKTHSDTYIKKLSLPLLQYTRQENVNNGRNVSLGIGSPYWLRSDIKTLARTWGFVDSYGSISNTNDYLYLGVAPCFCLAA